MIINMGYYISYYHGIVERDTMETSLLVHCVGYC